MATKKTDATTTEAGYSNTNATVPQYKPKEYDKEVLNAIFDALIFEGEYKEEVTVRGKLKVVFRTRSAEETMNITRQLDAADYKLLPTVQEQRAYLNISKSLLMYQGKDLSGVSDEEKRNYIKKLPTPILSSIADALAEFDRKVDMASRDAEASF